MHKLWLGLWIIAALSVNTLLADYKSMSEGHALFKQCTGCHGQAGERHALGKSLVINQMTKEQIIMSIEGYVDGTYGRSMKALMKGQVARLSKEQIEDIATYVASLNDNKLKSLVVPEAQKKKKSPPRKVTKYIPDSFKIKIKTYRYANQVTAVKAMVKHDSYTQREAEKRGVKQYYLTKMIFKEDEETILEQKCTPYLSTNGLIKFKYQSHGGKRLSLQVYNNMNKHAQHSVVIKERSATKEVNVLDINLKKLKIRSANDEAIRAYFGDVTLIPSDKIQLTGPEIAANGVWVPIDLRSSIKAKRVTLFANEEDAKLQMVVQWKLSSASYVDFSVRIKLLDYVTYGSTVSAVVEGVDGKFYVTHIKVIVGLGGVEG